MHGHLGFANPQGPRTMWFFTKLYNFECIDGSDTSALIILSMSSETEYLLDGCKKSSIHACGKLLFKIQLCTCLKRKKKT